MQVVRSQTLIRGLFMNNEVNKLIPSELYKLMSRGVYKLMSLNFINICIMRDT